MCHKSTICSIKQLPINHFARFPMQSCHHYSYASRSFLLLPSSYSCYSNRASKVRPLFRRMKCLFAIRFFLFLFFPFLFLLSFFLFLSFALYFYFSFSFLCPLPYLLTYLLHTLLHYSINFSRVTTDAFQLIQCTSHRRREQNVLHEEITFYIQRYVTFLMDFGT